tara:strand:- start:1953 stop:2159 length:207 start_codon:yes stop_codon:yes gene_type:complete
MFEIATSVQWILLIGVSISAFMIGKNYATMKMEEVIEHTILALIEQRMIKAKRDASGEYEIFEYDQET